MNCAFRKTCPSAMNSNDETAQSCRYAGSCCVFQVVLSTYVGVFPAQIEREKAIFKNLQND